MIDWTPVINGVQPILERFSNQVQARLPNIESQARVSYSRRMPLFVHRIFKKGLADPIVVGVAFILPQGTYLPPQNGNDLIIRGDIVGSDSGVIYRSLKDRVVHSNQIIEDAYKVGVEVAKVLTSDPEILVKAFSKRGRKRESRTAPIRCKNCGCRIYSSDAKWQHAPGPSKQGCSNPVPQDDWLAIAEAWHARLQSEIEAFSRHQVMKVLKTKWDLLSENEKIQVGVIGRESGYPDSLAYAEACLVSRCKS